MRKIMLLAFFISSVLLAQNENQNIELPDFIITGRQAVDIPTAAKPKTVLISILSNDFFTPQYSSEELPFLINSAPVSIYPSVKETEKYFSGNLKIMAGKETMPMGLFNLSHSFENYLLGVKAWGVNIAEYLPYSGYNSSGIELNNDFSVSTKSNILPGTKILADVKYYRDSYYLYGSNKPDQFREKNNLDAGVSVSSLYSKIFNFAFGTEGNIFSLKDNSLKETNVSAFGNINFRWNRMKFGGMAEINRQMLNNNLSGKSSYNNLSAAAFVEFIPMNGLWVNGGINYSTNSSNSILAPFAAAELLIGKGLIVGAEFKPRIENFNLKDIFKKNLFAALKMSDNVYTKYNSDLSVSIRYEFQKIFSIALTAQHCMADNYLYFEDILNIGKYDYLTASNVEIYKSKLSLFILPNMFGNLFAEVVLQDISNSENKLIPFEPVFNSTLSYNYSYSNLWGIGLNYKIEVGSYSDSKNTQKLENITDISVAGWYELISGFKLTADFQNILNKGNFAWKYYKGKPFDYLLGFEYRW